MLLFVYRMQTQGKYLNLANAVFSLKRKKKNMKGALSRKGANFCLAPVFIVPDVVVRK